MWGAVEEFLQWLHHEKPAVNLEARLPEGVGMKARGVHQQLRFHAVNLRRVHEQLKKMAEQRLFDFVGKLCQKRGDWATRRRRR